MTTRRRTTRPESPSAQLVTKAIERNMDSAYRELDIILGEIEKVECGSLDYNRLWEALDEQRKKLREWKRLRTATRRVR